MASLRQRALDLAAELGHPRAGVEHLILAWGEAERAEAKRTGRGGTRSSIPYHRACGRAEGLALAAGRAAPTPDEVLQSCLWSDDLDTLSGPAERQAVARGDGFVGTCHVLLALLTGEPDGRAAEALAECGVTHEGYAARTAEMLASCDPPPPRLEAGATPVFNPAGHELVSRAEGLAGAAGAAAVGSGHGAVAWLFERFGQPMVDLEAFGTSPAALCAALAARGVAVPNVPVPEPDRRAWGETVYFPADRLGDVLARLNRDLRAGDWGWNIHGDRAWADAVATVDLQAIVNDVLSA